MNRSRTFLFAFFLLVAFLTGASYEANVSHAATASCSGPSCVVGGITTTTTCPTAAAAGSTCTYTLTWSTAWPDTAYIPSCSGAGTITGFPSIQGITKATNTATVTVENGTANEAVASGYAEMDCIAVHP